MGACASDKANLYAYTITMAHEEALVLTKEWDPRTFPIFFLLSCRAFESHWGGRMNDRLLKILNKALIALQRRFSSSRRSSLHAEVNRGGTNYD